MRLVVFWRQPSDNRINNDCSFDLLREQGGSRIGHREQVRKESYQVGLERYTVVPFIHAARKAAPTRREPVPERDWTEIARPYIKCTNSKTLGGTREVNPVAYDRSHITPKREMLMVSTVCFIFTVRGPRILHYCTRFTGTRNSDIWAFRQSDSIGRSHHDPQCERIFLL
jgi:hypothetical protein